jgi:hypothetical protein
MKREGILNIMYYCVTFNRISGRQGKHLSKKKFIFTMIVLVTFRMRGKVLVILMPILMM